MTIDTPFRCPQNRGRPYYQMSAASYGNRPNQFKIAGRNTLTIRFTCRECGRPIAAAQQKVEQSIACPHCSTVQPVPSASLATPPASANSASPGDSATRDGLLITSRQLWAFGGLVLATGLIAFGLGWKFGMASAKSAKAERHGPVRLSGQVRGAAEGAVLFCFSEKKRPEQKLELQHSTVDQLLGDQALSDSLQQFGAKLVQVNGAGRFQVEIPAPGEHYLLVLSDRRGTKSDRATTQTLARLGRYFLRGDQLLGRFRWSWTELELNADEEITIGI